MLSVNYQKLCVTFATDTRRSKITITIIAINTSSQPRFMNDS